MTNSSPAASHILPPTIIEFLLDETGSMASHLTQTLAGFADFLDDQRLSDGECLFTLTKFDTTGLRTPYVDLDIDLVPYLTVNTFRPGAGTNLRDAIIERIDARRASLSEWPDKPRVLFVCMTDGEDNSSLKPSIMVRQRLEANDWAFIFLGAYPEAERTAFDLGFTRQNIRCFKGAQMRETMAELSIATKAYRAAATTPTEFYA